MLERKENSRIVYLYIIVKAIVLLIIVCLLLNDIVCLFLDQEISAATSCEIGPSIFNFHFSIEATSILLGDLWWGLTKAKIEVS